MLDWFGLNARDLPWRRTRDPYAIWVSEIMLQQTQVKTVIPYWERWMRELPTIEALADAPSEHIHKLWEGLGYYTRVRNMQKAARVIVEQEAGRFPVKYDDVLALPGIGRYTAGAICSIAFNQPAPILDGNVIRVLSRLFGIRENVKEKETNARLWELARELVSCASRIASKKSEIGNCSALNQSLMELGATVCSPRQPQCSACPLATRCVARKLGLAEAIPNLGERNATMQRRYLACIVEHNGAVLVRQRPQGVVNAHLWEFPNVEVPLKLSTRGCRRRLESELGCALDHVIPLTTLKHTITRYRMTLQAFRGELNGRMPQPAAGEWVAKEELVKLAFNSAHRRLLISALAPESGHPRPTAR
jgi:A/G-specific adenine glycosylase